MQTPRKQTLGVCYYPEHWPEERWGIDARMMVDAGITHVRIGEFAWSRIEPEPGHYDWGWLDTAFETLAAHGLGIVLGTPTATPPKWLVDTMPDMLAVGADGKTRGFGSRRHYCFSHQGYRSACARIVTDLAKRYGSSILRSSPGRRTMNMAVMTPSRAIPGPRWKAFATGWRRNTSRPMR